MHSYKSKTPLCTNISLNIVKRYYPLEKIVPKITKAMLEKQMILPRITLNKNNYALILYDPLRAQLIEHYKNHRDPSIKVMIELFKYDLLKVRKKTAYDTFKINMNNGLNLNNNITKEYVLEKLEKSSLKETEINYMLSTLLKENYPEHDIQNILLEFRYFFIKNPPTLQNAQLFLNIWDKYNSKFNPLNFIKEEKVIIKKEQKEKKELKKFQMLDEIQQLKMTADLKKNLIKFEKMFIYNNENVLVDIDNTLLDVWLKHLYERDTRLFLISEEKTITKKLKLFYENNKPEPNTLSSKNKAKSIIKDLKNNSNLPEFILQESPICKFPEDYDKEIVRIKKILEFLEHNKSFIIEDLKLLAIYSSAAKFDEEGTFKLLEETYKSFQENKELLDFKYTTKFADISFVLDKIKNKDFFVVKENELDLNNIINLGHLSHKTIIITDNITDKIILAHIGLLTSTNDDTTFVIDKYQQTNPDIDKQNKKQCYRIFSTFIIKEKEISQVIDIETTLLFRGLNSAGQDISQLLWEKYEEKKSIWSKNPYQYSFEGSAEFLQNITFIFFRKQLDYLEQESKMLNENLKKIYAESPELYENTLNKLRIEKEKEITDKVRQQYFSLLPEKFLNIYKALKFVEIKEEKETAEIKKTLRNKEINARLKDVADVKAQQDHSKEKKEKTAKEKREDYIKNKQKQQDEEYI